MSAPVGRVLVLNGTSSSGKTSLVRALQERWDGPLLDAGLDRHLAMLPRRYLGARWAEVYRYRYDDDGAITAIEVGPVGAQLHRAMHRCVAAAARAGSDVVVDHVLLERRWALDLALALEGLGAWVVGVRCPPEVLVAREQARADRTVGQALAQLHVAHAHGSYDLEVDTSEMGPGAAADVVLARMGQNIEGASLARWRRAGGDPA